MAALAAEWDKRLNAIKRLAEAAHAEAAHAEAAHAEEKQRSQS
jgi:hypothetical protein